MTGRTAWWETFFSGLWLEVQRRMRDDERTRAEADFLVQVLDLADGSVVLDAPCGVGRLAVELASRGHEATGLDRSSELLADARTAAEERGVEVELQQGDLREAPWPGRFDAVFCMWGSFGYFDAAGDLAHARAAYESLRPGGRFLIDLPVMETLLPEFRARHWEDVGDIRMLTHTWVDLEEGRVNTQWTFRQGDVETMHESSIRLYTYRELRAVLCEAGFASFSAYGDRYGTPFTFGARRLHLVATK